MSNEEMWFWFGIACVTGMTIARIFRYIARCFYHKYDAPIEYDYEIAKLSNNQTKDKDD